MTSRLDNDTHTQHLKVAGLGPGQRVCVVLAACVRVGNPGANSTAAGRCLRAKHSDALG